MKTCHHLLRIFSDDKNRFPIQQELSFAAEFFENASAADIKALAAKNTAESGAPCPFPFITTCLNEGASYVPGTEVTAGVPTIMGVRDEAFRVKYSTEQNRYGIMVLDITDLGRIRYCFVDVRDIELDLDRKVPSHTPFDGWTYLRAFEKDRKDLDSEIDDGLEASTEGLEKFDLVELSALANCWPSEDWKIAASEGDSNDELANSGSSRMPVPSLRTLSQIKLFQELLSSDGPPDLSLLDLPMLFRGFTQELQRYLIDNADALSKSPVACEILEKAFAGVASFDFSPFQGKLSADTLVALASSEAMRNVKTVNFSRLDSIKDMRVVATVLEHANIDNLYLLARPDRMADNLSEMIKSLSGCSERPLVRQRLVLGSAFSQGLRQSDLRPQMPAHVELSFWKTFPVIQLLYSGPREFNIWFMEEPWLTSFFLGDACLTPARFVSGLLNVIKGRCNNAIRAARRMLEGERDVPLAFACAPSSLKTLTTSTEINPMPANGAACSNLENDIFDSWGRVLVRDLQDLSPDVWTAVVVHTAIMDWEDDSPVPGKTRYRVALVRSKRHAVAIRHFRHRTFELEVVDLKQFLELTAPEHAGDLEANLSELTAWAQTDDALVSKLGMNETIATLQAFAENTE